MTFLGSSHWQNSSVAKLLAGASALVVLASCAASEIDESTDLKHPRHVKRSISTEFEWAVQNYEAGDYAKSIRQFERLRKEGSAVPEFDLLPYFLGMSHFRLGHNEKAASELEAFVRSGGERRELQEARLSLLMTYEKQSRWEDLNALAAETNKQTLFQNNRALLKLLWARALREKNELLGAKAALQEATPYLDKLEQEERPPPVSSEPEHDLWGRYHFTAVLLQLSDCLRLEPRDLSASKAKAKAKQRPERLYGPWLEANADCLRKAVTYAGAELFFRESTWNSLAESNVQLGIKAFAEKTQQFLRDESPRIDRHRALQKSAREQFYRLLGTIDENLKSFKNKELDATHLLNIRRQVDRLLVGISNPS